MQNSCLIIHSAKTTSPFIDAFNDLLFQTSLDFDSILASGDFNIHVNNNNGVYYSRELNNLLEAFGFSEHVTGTTYELGHTFYVQRS